MSVGFIWEHLESVSLLSFLPIFPSYFSVVMHNSSPDGKSSSLISSLLLSFSLPWRVLLQFSFVLFLYEEKNTTLLKGIKGALNKQRGTPNPQQEVSTYQSVLVLREENSVGWLLQQQTLENKFLITGNVPVIKSFCHCDTECLKRRLCQEEEIREGAGRSEKMKGEHQYLQNSELGLHPN